MPRKYVKTRQSDVVTPTRPTPPSEGSRGFTPPAFATAFPYALTSASSPPREQSKHNHWQSISKYDSTTAVAVLAVKIATKLFTTAMTSLPVQIQKHPPLDECRIPYLRVDTAPPNIPAQRTGEIRQPSPARANRPSCDSFVSYGPDTPMRRMRRLSDTKKIAPATKTVARPIWRATVSHTNSRTIHPNQHYETRPADQRLFAIRLLAAKRFYVMAPAPRPHQQPTYPPRPNTKPVSD